jgi:hypothetical protein
MKAIAISQRAGVLRGRLTMRAHRAGLLGSYRSEAEDSVGVAYGIRVVCEACSVWCARLRLGESCEGGAMKAQATSWLERVLDREAGELVAERDRAHCRFDQHPRAQAFVERGRVLARERFEQPQFHL